MVDLCPHNVYCYRDGVIVKSKTNYKITVTIDCFIFPTNTNYVIVLIYIILQ